MIHATGINARYVLAILSSYSRIESYANINIQHILLQLLSYYKGEYTIVILRQHICVLYYYKCVRFLHYFHLNIDIYDTFW